MRAAALACLALAACGAPPNVQTPRSPADPAGSVTDGRTTIAVAPDTDEVCRTGRTQSPVDLEAPERGDLQPLDPAWKPSAGMVIDGEHALVVELEDAGGLTLGDTDYPLESFHVHGPSEHTIAGATHPLELHFVHRSADDRLAVIGVFVAEGAANPALGAMLDALPDAKMEGRPLAEIDPSALLPDGGERVFYRGSLTVPPCTEGVAWNVLTTPIEASAEQIAIIKGRHPINARPVQPLGERPLLVASPDAAM